MSSAVHLWDAQIREEVPPEYEIPWGLIALASVVVIGLVVYRG